MPAANATPPEWVNAREAARILGVPGPRNVHRIAKEGLLKTRDLPGVRARFLRADVERLARESARPALG